MAIPTKQTPDFDSLISTTGAGGEVHQHAGEGGERLTTAQGVVIADNQNSLRAGAPGPGLPPPSGPVSVLEHDGPLIHWDDAFRGRRALAKGAVWANSVVVDTPLLDDDPGFADGVEDLAVEQFVPEPRVEALDVAVFPG